MTDKEIPTYDELDRDLWIRKTKLLYPEVEDWVIEMAVDAWIKNEGKEIEFKKEEYERERANMFQGTEYMYKGY